MELDELKHIFKNSTPTSVPVKTAEQLEQLVLSKTKSPIAKVKRSLLFEVIFTGICLPFIIYFGFTNNIGWMKFYLGFMTAISFVFIITLTKLRKKISALQQSTNTLKYQLQQIHNILSAFIMQYMQLSIWFYIFCFVYGFGSGFYDGYTSQNTKMYEDSVKHLPKNIWMIIGGTIVYIAVLFVGIYYFTKWYLKKLYGNYLTQIKSLLEELES